MAEKQRAWSKDLQGDLYSLYQYLYQPLNFSCSLPVKEAESAEYAAYHYIANNLATRFRLAKITPKKIGAFVTLWKRSDDDGPIQPFDSSDNIDLVVVAVRKERNFGYFVFPKMILLKYGILSKNGKGGKRALRVYPPWDTALNTQAQKTQRWQLEYFLNIPDFQKLDLQQAKKLYCS